MRAIFAIWGCLLLMGLGGSVGCVPDEKKTETCKVTGDCLAGKVCKGGLCSACTGDGDCTSGNNKCINGACRDGCRQDSDCSAQGARCVLNNCLVGCSGNQDCKDNEICEQSKCKAKCASQTDCPKNFFCNTETGACQNCVADSQCGTGQKCIDGQCSCPEANRCGSECFDVTTNVSHCGICGNACASGLCTASICRLTGTQVALSANHSCALTREGQVRCWGANSSGALGDRTERNRNSPAIAEVLGSEKVVALSLQAATLEPGYESTCVLLDGGTVKCWGENGEGQLGLGDLNAVTEPREVKITGVKQLVSGKGLKEDGSVIGLHRCALLNSGKAMCWGDNSHGQLGDLTKQRRTVPTEVKNLQDVIQLAAGGGHTCALQVGGKIFCWGRNKYGQLGVGHRSSLAGPIEVSGGHKARSITAGVDHTCAALDGGEVICWGRNDSGQIGDGSRDDRLEPVKLKDLKDTSYLAAGLGHTCSLHNNGQVRCWGRNRFGAIGKDSSVDEIVNPTLLILKEASFLAVGQLHTCLVMKANFAVKCWGFNRWGQIGDRSTDNRPAPSDVSEN